MANERLAAALEGSLAGSRLRQKAIQQANQQRGVYYHCGFCASEFATQVLSGPITGICEDCALLAGAFYLARFKRTIAKQATSYDECWRDAVRDYRLEKLTEPKFQRSEREGQE